MARSISDVLGSACDATVGVLDTITKSFVIADNIVDSGVSYTDVWRVNAKLRSISSIADSKAKVIHEDAMRHKDRAAEIEKLSAEGKKVYEARVKHLSALLSEV